MSNVKSNEVVELELLEKYPRAIAHLRRQYDLGRLALIFGSGINKKKFNLPDWSGLIDSIAKDKEVDGKRILDSCAADDSLPYKTQILYEHFRRRNLDKSKNDERATLNLEYRVAYLWNDIVRRNLYADAPTAATLDKCVRDHPYLREYLPIILKTQMTVTYNFDDLLERAIEVDPDRGEAERRASRGYQTVTNLWGQFRDKTANIYHAHGFFLKLPLKCQETGLSSGKHHTRSK